MTAPLDRETPTKFQFGPFEVDRARFLLTRSGHRIGLPRISLEILLLLVERHGLLVTRAEIVDVVWPGSDPEEKAQGVTTAINRIRQALRDDPAKPRYVETVIGKGYRFIGVIENLVVAEPSVAASADAASALSAEEASPELSFVSVPASIHSTPRLRLVWWLALTAVVVAGMFVVAQSHLLRHSGSENLRDIRLSTPVTVTLNDSDNPVSAAGLSQDGKRLAYADTEGLKLLEWRGPAPAVPLPLALARLPLQVIDRIRWFPDGKHLLIGGLSSSGAAPELWIASASPAGDPSRLLRTDADTGVLSADARRVFYLSANAHELWEVQENGTAPRMLLRCGTDEVLFEPVALPDGRRLLVQRRPRLMTSSLMVADADSISVRDGSQTTLLTVRETDGSILLEQPSAMMSGPQITADGTILYVSHRSHLEPMATTKLDLKSTRFQTPPKPLAAPPGQNVEMLSLAATGDVAILMHSGRLGVMVAGLRDSGHTLEPPHALNSPLAAAYPHAWTPDSRAVLFEQDLGNKTDGLFQQDITERVARPLLAPALAGNGVRLSPDHRWLLFYRHPPDAAQQAFRLRFDGHKNAAGPVLDSSVQAERLPIDSGDFRCPVTGTRCVWRNNDAAAHRIVFSTLDPATGATRPLLSLPWEDPAQGDWDVSPDGTQVVLCAGLPGELHTISLASKSEHILRWPVEAPFQSVNWQAAGTGWYASVSVGDTAVLYKLDPGGRATAIHKGTAPTWGVPSPDGRWLAFLDLNRERNVWMAHLSDSKP